VPDELLTTKPPPLAGVMATFCAEAPAEINAPAMMTLSERGRSARFVFIVVVQFVDSPMDDTAAPPSGAAVKRVEVCQSSSEEPPWRRRCKCRSSAQDSASPQRRKADTSCD
jgi:hypothetical protein